MVRKIWGVVSRATDFFDGERLVVDCKVMRQLWELMYAQASNMNCGSFGGWRSSHDRGLYSRERAAKRPLRESMKCRYDLWKRPQISRSINDEVVELI